MSGGHFDYKQYLIDYIADEVEQLIEKNHEKDEYDYSYNFSEKTIEKFKQAKIILRIAAIYAQRIDWLVSGDDGEENFHKRLEEDLSTLEKDIEFIVHSV